MTVGQTPDVAEVMGLAQDAPVAADLETLSKDELKALAQDQGLPTSGNKTELIERLGG